MRIPSITQGSRKNHFSNGQRISIVVTLILLSFFASPQHSNFNTNRLWSLNKKELQFGLGMTHFNGDLGGINKPGPNYGFRDFKWPATSWFGVCGYRYRLHPYWATTSSLEIGELRGNDALKIHAVQQKRNLHFRSTFVAITQRIECLFLTNERFTTRYRTRKRLSCYSQLYAFVGVGLLYYNPQAHYNGQWVDLHALHTEGQDLPGGAKPYTRITGTIPLGLGINFKLTQMWKMAIEASYTFTFTDYLDDVGGKFYDPNVLAEEFGEASAYLSNPSTGNSEIFANGQYRGDAREDAYFSLGFRLHRNLL